MKIFQCRFFRIALLLLLFLFVGMVVCVRRPAILGHSHTERYHVQNSDYLNRTDTLMYDEKHHHKGHMTSSYPTEKTPLMPDVVADFPTISRKNSEAEDFAVRVEGHLGERLKKWKNAEEETVSRSHNMVDYQSAKFVWETISQTDADQIRCIELIRSGCLKLCVSYRKNLSQYERLKLRQLAQPIWLFC